MEGLSDIWICCQNPGGEQVPRLVVRFMESLSYLRIGPRQIGEKGDAFNPSFSPPFSAETANEVLQVLYVLKFSQTERNLSANSYTIAWNWRCWIVEDDQKIHKCLRCIIHCCVQNYINFYLPSFGGGRCYFLYLWMAIKGTVPRDFRLQVFYMDQFPLGP